jgi:hypothetical protein
MGIIDKLNKDFGRNRLGLMSVLMVKRLDRFYRDEGIIKYY